jgi:cysteinyl-tRNA synthetase
MGYDADDYLKMGIELSDEKIDEKIRQRESARAAKDFAMSDQIRDELLALDIILEDSINGTTWRRK